MSSLCICVISPNIPLPLIHLYIWSALCVTNLHNCLLTDTLLILHRFQHPDTDAVLTPHSLWPWRRAPWVPSAPHSGPGTLHGAVLTPHSLWLLASGTLSTVSPQLWPGHPAWGHASWGSHQLRLQLPEGGCLPNPARSSPHSGVHMLHWATPTQRPKWSLSLLWATVSPLPPAPGHPPCLTSSTSIRTELFGKNEMKGKRNHCAYF